MFRNAIVAACFAMVAPLAARADDVADFYRGKTINVVVGHEVGTGYDAYSRALSRHYSRHMPGAPAVSVSNMQGASGMAAANWLYNIAPRDGTVMATYTHAVIFEPLLGDATARFDPLKFTYIANLDESILLCFVSRESGISRFEDLMTKEVQFGGSGAGTAGPLSQTPNAVRNLTGAKIKLIQGYRGSYDIKLAIDRGELNGICGIPLSTARSEWRDLVDSGRVKALVQLAPNRHADLPDTPTIYEFMKNEADRPVFDLIFGTQGLGRAYMGAPGVPEPRVAALRKAMMDTMADPAFLAEAKTAGLDITPTTGDTVAALLAKFYASPKEAIDRAKKAVRGN